MEEPIYLRCSLYHIWFPRTYKNIPKVSSNFTKKSQKWKKLWDHWQLNRRRPCKGARLTSQGLPVKEENQRFTLKRVRHPRVAIGQVYMHWQCNQLGLQLDQAPDTMLPFHTHPIGTRWEVLDPGIIQEVVTHHLLVTLLYIRHDEE